MMNKPAIPSASFTQSGSHIATTVTLEMWQVEVSLGNECYSTEQYLVALSHYHQAITIAESLLWGYCNEDKEFQFSDQHPEPNAFVAMLLVSYHNLADLYLMKREYGLAERAYQQANERLITAIETIAEGSAMHLALLSGVNRNRTLLHLHQKEHGKTAERSQATPTNVSSFPYYSTLRSIQ